MTPVRLPLVLAGIFGAAGVALSAVAAHRADLPNLGTAANMLLFHAPAFLALSVMSMNRQRTIGTFGLALGVLLFSADLVARAFLGSRLFPMAAPTGGTLMIAGWLLLALSAFMKTGQTDAPKS